jgi:hypothetical protein
LSGELSCGDGFAKGGPLFLRAHEQKIRGIFPSHVVLTATASPPAPQSMASSPVESARVGLFSVHTSDDIRDSSVAEPRPPRGRGAAVIFGWVGSTPRLLKRYASLYLSACNLKAVYTVTADTVSVFMRPRRLRALMQSALAILEVGDE